MKENEKAQRSPFRGMLCYLAGQMEHSSDNGISLRQDIKKTLAELNLLWNDPTDKGLPEEYGPLSEAEAEQNRIKTLRNRGSYYQLSHFMRDIKTVDMAMMHQSDLVIAYIDPAVHTCGTYREIFSALDAGKAVYIICQGGREACPVWLFAEIDYKLIFADAGELYNYMIHGARMTYDPGEHAMPTSLHAAKLSQAVAAARRSRSVWSTL